MIIVLDEKNKADLAFLQQLPPNIVEEFCRISLELIRKGNVNRAIFKNAAGASLTSPCHAPRLPCGVRQTQAPS